MKKSLVLSSIALASLLTSCASQKNITKATPVETTTNEFKPQYYSAYTLTTDLSHLTPNEKNILRLMIKAADVMDDIFWQQAYGAKIDIIDEAKGAQLDYVKINYGPWDRLDNEKPFTKTNKNIEA